MASRRSAGFSALKQRAIAELGYGPWGISSGEILTDLGFQNTWEVTRAQPGTEGILNNYTGGAADAGLTDTTPSGIDEAARVFLAELENVFPGIGAEWNGRASLSTPATEPLRRGSYACYLVGQITTFGGAEGFREGNCHFAGEHTSVDLN